MLETIIEFSRYWFAIFFGVLIAINFAGIETTKKNNISIFLLIISIFSIQLICLFSFGMDITLKIYPLISHLPMGLILIFYLKAPLLNSIIIVFTSFLCFQPSRWIGSLFGSIFNNVSANHIGYIISIACIYYFLKKYVSKSVNELINKSRKSCLLFGFIPTFYYFFDYTFTVYTNFMYSGSRIAVQLMPFVTSAFYFVFVLIYYNETQKQIIIQRDLDMLYTQFKQAQTEFNSLKQIQHTAATYRHDMRHHILYLQNLCNEGSIEKIKEYLFMVQSDIDSITPMKFCENETVNLILSSFYNKAKIHNITFNISAHLPELTPFSNTELCSLLSNALENAIHACKDLDDINNKFISLRMYSKNNKLCIDIRNSYLFEPVFKEGIPISKESGHGFGTKSMAHIIEKHGGVYDFYVKDNLFIFQSTT